MVAHVRLNWLDCSSIHWTKAVDNTKTPLITEIAARSEISQEQLIAGTCLQGSLLLGSRIDRNSEELDFLGSQRGRVCLHWCIQSTEQK